MTNWCYGYKYTSLSLIYSPEADQLGGTDFRLHYIYIEEVTQVIFGQGHAPSYTVPVLMSSYIIATGIA